MKVELNEKQVKALIQLINVSSVRGSEVEFVAELKRTLEKALEESKKVS